jgi:hypothetical protein
MTEQGRADLVMVMVLEAALELLFLFGLAVVAFYYM